MDICWDNAHDINMDDHSLITDSWTYISIHARTTWRAHVCGVCHCRRRGVSVFCGGVTDGRTRTDGRFRGAADFVKRLACGWRTALCVAVYPYQYASLASMSLTYVFCAAISFTC